MQAYRRQPYKASIDEKLPMGSVDWCLNTRCASPRLLGRACGQACAEFHCARRQAWTRPVAQQYQRLRRRSSTELGQSKAAKRRRKRVARDGMRSNQQARHGAHGISSNGMGRRTTAAVRRSGDLLQVCQRACKQLPGAVQGGQESCLSPRFVWADVQTPNEEARTNADEGNGCMNDGDLSLEDDGEPWFEEESTMLQKASRRHSWIRECGN